MGGQSEDPSPNPCVGNIGRKQHWRVMRWHLWHPSHFNSHLSWWRLNVEQFLFSQYDRVTGLQYYAVKFDRWYVTLSFWASDIHEQKSKCIWGNPLCLAFSVVPVETLVEVWGIFVENSGQTLPNVCVVPTVLNISQARPSPNQLDSALDFIAVGHLRCQ